MDGAIIKSVGRVLALLEFFDETRRPATVMEVARALGMPQSSTSALLRSMVALGYCALDEQMRSYVPTARVSLLGSWLSAPLIEDGPLIRMLHELRERTGEHVLLAAMSGPMLRFIYSVPALNPDRPHIRTGTMRPLGRSGVGNLFLAIQPDKKIASLVRRANAEERNAAYRIDLPTLMTEIGAIRARGYCVALDKMTHGIGGVTVLLPRLARMQPMAVALSAPSSVIDRHHRQFFDQIRKAVRDHLGNELPPVGP